jgi:transposase InsO family protein
LIIRTDGGKQFSSQEFVDFCKDHGIESILSSAHYPQSNGHAKAGVKAMKDLVCKCWINGRLNQDLFGNALLEWRNTPRSDGLSPSQCLFGFTQRTSLPASVDIYGRVTADRFIEAKKRVSVGKEKTLHRYNLRSRHLSELMVGQHVRIRNPKGGWDRQGVIIGVRHGGISYSVNSNGSTLLHNRRLLKPIVL